MGNEIEKLSKNGLLSKECEQNSQESGKTKTGSVPQRHSGLEGPRLEGPQRNEPGSSSCLFPQGFC